MYPEYQNTILSGLFCPKNTDDKKSRFFDKNHAPTNLENFDFCRFLKLPFSGLKSILFYTDDQNDLFWLDLPKKTQMIKSSIFLQKPWKPLENFDFFVVFLKLPFSGLRRIFFVQNNKKTIFSVLICPKNTDDKKFDFLTKTTDLPVGKFRFFGGF